MKPYYEDDHVTLYHGDARDVLADLPDASVDAVVTDPPYELGFMGKGWDASGIAYSVPMWTEVLRVLKPGGHVLAFGGTRTWHRMVVAIEDAGFEIRDELVWLYGSGFPKSLDVSKAIDKAARGVPQGGSDPTSPNHGKYRTIKTEGKRCETDRGQGYGAGGSRFLADGATARAASEAAEIAPEAEQWNGWGTALKPAHEPICVARKPLVGTVAANVLAHGTGALNIDATRISPTSHGDARSSRGDSRSCTCPSPATDQTTRTECTLREEEPADEPSRRSGPPASGREGAGENPRPQDSRAGCHPSDGSGGAHAHGAPGVDRASVQRPPDARTPLGRCGECGRNRGTTSKPCAESTTGDVETLGRWPANVVLDEAAAAMLDQQSGDRPGFASQRHLSPAKPGIFGVAHGSDTAPWHEGYNDSGGASRFFYVAKAASHERPTVDGRGHPTVKPVALMRWLVRLVTPPGGLVLDPFAGTGTTAEAAIVEGFRCTLIEAEADHLPLIQARLAKPIAPTLFGGAS